MSLDRLAKLNSAIIDEGFNSIGDSVWDVGERPRWFGINCIDAAERVRRLVHEECDGTVGVFESDNHHRVSVWYAPDGRSYLFDPTYWLIEPSLIPGNHCSSEYSSFPCEDYGFVPYEVRLDNTRLVTDWKIMGEGAMTREYDLRRPVPVISASNVFRLVGNVPVAARYLSDDRSKECYLNMSLHNPSVIARVGMYSPPVRSDGDSARFAHVFDEVSEIIGASPREILNCIREAVHRLKSKVALVNG